MQGEDLHCLTYRHSSSVYYKATVKTDDSNKKPTAKDTAFRMRLLDALLSPVYISRITQNADANQKSVVTSDNLRTAFCVCDLCRPKSCTSDCVFLNEKRERFATLCIKFMFLFLKFLCERKPSLTYAQAHNLVSIHEPILGTVARSDIRATSRSFSRCSLSHCLSHVRREAWSCGSQDERCPIAACAYLAKENLDVT